MLLCNNLSRFISDTLFKNYLKMNALLILSEKICENDKNCLN